MIFRALIFARQNSKSVPQKNKLFFNGKPLFMHVVTTASQVSSINDVFVVTDDSDIMHLCDHYGIQTLHRTPESASDTATIDESLVDLLNTKEGQFLRDSNIITIQPTSPFLSAKTIEGCIQKFTNSQAACTVFTVKEVRKLFWKQTNSGFQPLYHSRVNRQSLDPLYQETGALVIAPASSILKFHTRFIPNSLPFIHSYPETIDIDTLDDLAIATRHVSRRHIYIDFVASKKNGFGHLGRQLVLYTKLQQYHKVDLIAHSSQDLAFSYLRDRHIPITPYSDLSSRAKLVSGADLLIKDTLDSLPGEIVSLKKKVSKVITFEDLSTESSYADLSINSMSSPAYSSVFTNQLNGMDYVVLRDEFNEYCQISKARSSKRIESISSLLIMFGGTDASNLTEKVFSWVLSAISSRPSSLRSIHIITGPGKTTNLKSFSHSIPNLKVYHYQTIGQVAHLMSNCDMAITSCGRTVFELSSLFIPCLTIAVGPREEDHWLATSGSNVIYLGRDHSVSESDFRATFNDILHSSTLRRQLIKSLSNLSLTSGTQRVLDAINNTLNT